MAKEPQDNIVQLQSVVTPEVYSALVSRAVLASKLGYQYGGDRDIYEALGYKVELTYGDYATQYERQDMAKAIIDRPVTATWRGGFSLVETDDDEETKLEKEFDKLYKELRLLSVFSRLDRLTGLGKYGVLLLGIGDTKNAFDLVNPLKGSKHQLMYLRPFGEGSATVDEYVTDTSDERYGKPLLYTLKVENISTKDTSDLKVHHTRVIHVVDGMLESEVEGTPRLQVVFNRLKDLEKLVGASAEMFWRGARPGYQGKIDPDFNLTAELKADLQDQIDEYEHKLRRILMMQGVELQALASQVANPMAHVDVQIQMISAVTGIPKRILTGSERGELASTEDKSSWFELIESRRQDFAEAWIVRPFIDWCIELGVLPEPKDDYSIQWQDLWALGDQEKAEIGRTRASALKEYSASPAAEAIVPPDAFLEYFLGLDPNEIEVITEMREAMMKEEEEERKKLEAEGLEPEEPEQPEAPEKKPEEPEQPEAPEAKGAQK